MDLAQVFLTPQNTTHRQYEALRAYFVDRLPVRRSPDASVTPTGHSTNWSTSSAASPTASSSSSRPAQGPRPTTQFDNESSNSASKTSRSTISAKPSRKKASRGRRLLWRDPPQGGLCQTAAARRCRAAARHQAHRGRSRRRAGIEPRTTDSSAPSSAACFCSCPRWLRLASIA